MCGLLVLATLSAYAKTFHNGFVDLDDVAYVTNNPHIKAGLHWNTVKWAAAAYYESNWHPLTWISHAADISLFHLNPLGPHAVNLLLHAANAVLLFVLLLIATKRDWPSFFAAAVFALHPINVESVAWVSERKNVLSMLLLLVAMIAYTVYVKRPSLWRYGWIVAFFALGLAAKPQIITLPFLLLLWDYWPLRRWRQQERSVDSANHAGQWPQWLWLVVEKLPLFLLSAISAVVTMKAQAAGGAIQVSAGAQRAVAAFPFSIRLENGIVAYAQYLLDAVWPLHLSAMYPHPGTSLQLSSVILAGAVLFAITALAWVTRETRSYTLMGWLWFLGAMVPMIGIVQVGSQARADRYAYLPFVGLFLIAAWGAADIAEEWPTAKTGIAAASCAASLALALVTYRQTGYWRNSETLWNQTLQTTKGNFFAHDSLGRYLVVNERMGEACPHFEESLRILPTDVMAQEGLGVCYQARGELSKAVAEYQSVLRLSVDRTVRATAFANLGSIYRQQRNFVEAKRNYEAALELNPDMPGALVGLGLLAQQGWDFATAAKQYARAMSVEPTSVGYLLLAKALEQSGRGAEARDAYETARRMSGNLAADQKEANGLLAN